MDKKEQLYEGKAKKVFATENPEPVSYTHLAIFHEGSPWHIDAQKL